MATMMSVIPAKKIAKHSEDPVLRYRLPLIVLSQIILIFISYYFSFVLRLDSNFDASAHSLFWQTLPLVLVVKLVVFYHFGLLRGWWRYVGMSDVLNIAGTAFVSAVLAYGLIVVGIRVSGYPRSVVLIDMVLTMAFVGGARVMVRAYTERARKYDGQKNT